MKIRSDFVTNSSSTSFIIISNNPFNFKDFVEAVGISQDSQFMNIYQGLFQAFSQNMTPARDYYENFDRKDNFPTFEEFIKGWFWYGKELWPKIQEAEKSGKKIYVGNLRSDENDIESFFCTDEFIIESDNLKIDARENGW